jgi:hypothetical protein
MYFVLCRLYLFSPPSHYDRCLGPIILPVIFLLLTNTVPVPVRACLSIWLERFRGAQKENDGAPLSIQSSLSPRIWKVWLRSWYTDKKENQIFLIYKEILNGAVANLYMTNALPRYGEYLRISSYIRKPFLIYDFATAPLWISLYMRKIGFSF